MAVLCPRCEKEEFTPYGEPFDVGDPFPPALSRLSRGQPGPDFLPIWVCSSCGTDEAMREFSRLPLQTPDEWPIGDAS